MTTDIHNIKAICDNVAAIVAAKNEDYNGAFARRYEKRGASYAVDKIGEKCDRIEHLSFNANKVDGETLKDALRDCMGYCALYLDQIEQS